MFLFFKEKVLQSRAAAAALTKTSDESLYSNSQAAGAAVTVVTGDLGVGNDSDHY